jgi:hypothetical protein
MALGLELAQILMLFNNVVIISGSPLERHINLNGQMA